MTRYCWVKNCGNNTIKTRGGKISYYQIPKVITKEGEKMEKLSQARRDKWLKVIKYDGSRNLANVFVCSEHFHGGKPNWSLDPVHPDYVPSLKLSKPCTKSPSAPKLERYHRAANRSLQKDGNPLHESFQIQDTEPMSIDESSSEETLFEPVCALLTDADYEELHLPFPQVEDEVLEQNHVLPHDVFFTPSEEERDSTFPANGEEHQPSSAPSADIMDHLSALKVEVDFQRTELSSLKNDTSEELRKLKEELHQESAFLQQAMDELKKFQQEHQNHNESSNLKDSLLERIAKDDSLTRFYTGLHTYKMFENIFTLCEPVLTDHGNSKLSLKEQLLVTLMKLRLHLKNRDLAYRFAVHQSTISRTFQKWIGVLYCRLKPILMKWPRQDDVKHNIPHCFKEFPNVIGIIDGFEVFCHRHHDLLDRASTYSSYKHHNTCKFLCSCSPHGVINFISRAYGGRITDQEIVQHSGFLDVLQPNDLILADRGFTVEDLIGLKGARLRTPAFKGPRAQLTQNEVEQSRVVSNARIHIERVIAHLKDTYTILRGPINTFNMSGNPDEDFAFIDKIVVVCCCLLNTLPGIIPLD